VSVILAAYNHAPFVGQTIESVLSQSFRDFEFIITDDGSSDETVEVICSYEDPRIQLAVFPENRGACEATNHCIDRSKGEYIAVINSDDWFLPDKLKIQVEVLDRQPWLAAVFSKVLFVDEAGSPTTGHNAGFPPEFVDNMPNRFAWLRFFFFTGNALCHPTAMIRSSVYNELGQYNAALRQLPDFDMWVRVCGRHEIRVLPEALTAYRLLDGLRNISAPVPTTIQRSIWEASRVLRRFLDLDEATVHRTFAGDIPSPLLACNAPVPLILAQLAASRPEPHLQLFAIETLEEAVATGVPGVGPADLHELTGRLDPMGTERERMLQAALHTAQETSAERERMLQATQQSEATLTERFVAVESELRTVCARLDATEANLAAVHASTSWRLTAPLRLAGSRLRKR
jgi:glycosyltransferase involved in cell wall biosynthesis